MFHRRHGEHLNRGDVSRHDQLNANRFLLPRPQAYPAQRLPWIAFTQHQMHGVAAPAGIGALHSYVASPEDRPLGWLDEAQSSGCAVAFQRRFQAEIEGLRAAAGVAQGQAEVIGDAVVAVGFPGCAGVEVGELSRLHLPSAQGAALQAGDGP